MRALTDGGAVTDAEVLELAGYLLGRVVHRQFGLDLAADPVASDGGDIGPPSSAGAPAPAPLSAFRAATARSLTH